MQEPSEGSGPRLNRLAPRAAKIPCLCRAAPRRAPAAALAPGRGETATLATWQTMTWHPPNPIRYEIPETRWPTEEEAARALLFQPLNTGPLSLNTRTWVPAMVPWRATEDGFVTPENLDW